MTDHRDPGTALLRGGEQGRLADNTAEAVVSGVDMIAPAPTSWHGVRPLRQGARPTPRRPGERAGAPSVRAAVDGSRALGIEAVAPAHRNTRSRPTIA